MKSPAKSGEDDGLEAIFKESTVTQIEGETHDGFVTKKRTREEIVRDLKAKRSKGGIETQPRFRPITQKPPQQKKQKLDTTKPTEPLDISGLEKDSSSGPIIDIFAGVEEYEGLNLGDDDEGPSGSDTSKRSTDNVPREGSRLRNWFEDEGKPGRGDAPLPFSGQASGEDRMRTADEDLEQATERAGRLAALASSSIQSISHFLAVDGEIEKEEKRRAKRAKRKGRRTEQS